jgi:hypothetical protein
MPPLPVSFSRFLLPFIFPLGLSPLGLFPLGFSRLVFLPFNSFAFRQLCRLAFLPFNSFTDWLFCLSTALPIGFFAILCLKNDPVKVLVTDFHGIFFPS